MQIERVGVKDCIVLYFLNLGFVETLHFHLNSGPFEKKEVVWTHAPPIVPTQVTSYLPTETKTAKIFQIASR